MGRCWYRSYRKEEKTVYLPEAKLNLAGSQTTQPSVTVTADKTVKSGADTSPYYVEVKTSSTEGAVAANVGLVDNKVGVVGNTALEGEERQKTIATSAEITNEANKIHILEATIGVKGENAEDIADYAENTSAIVPSKGYLVINEGYVSNTKISLATLIPDFPEGTNVAGGDQILEGYQVFDEDGNIITGTIGEAQISPNKATASANVSITGDNSLFSEDETDFPITITGTASVGASTVTVGKGYVSETKTTTVEGASDTKTETKYLKAGKAILPTLTNGKLPLGSSVTLSAGYYDEPIILAVQTVDEIPQFNGEYVTYPE